jgi:hypothetical protein
MKKMIAFLLSFTLYSLYCQTPEILSITSSSTLNDRNNKYIVDNLILDNKESWAEGVDGPGINESITITFKSQATINELYIKNGYGDYKHFYENNRVKVMRYNVDGRGSGWIVLQDKPGFQLITFDQPVNTSKITLTILDVYPGTKYNDTCLSKISFLNWNKLKHATNDETLVYFHSEKIYDFCGNYLKAKYSIDPNKIIDSRHGDKAINFLVNTHPDHNNILPLQDGSVNFLIEISRESIMNFFNVDIKRKNIIFIFNLDKELKLNQKLIPRLSDFLDPESSNESSILSSLYSEAKMLSDCIDSNIPWESDFSLHCYNGIIEFIDNNNAFNTNPILSASYHVYNNSYQYISRVSYP